MALTSALPMTLTACQGGLGTGQGKAQKEFCAMKPSASNTGPTGALVDDPTTVLDDGETLKNVRVPSLEIRGHNVTVRNVEVVGNIFVTGDDATIDHVRTTGIAVSSASGATIEHTDVGNGTDDGIHLTSDSGRKVREVVLRYNYVHSPRVAPDSHYDGTQVRGIDGLRVTCSTYDAGAYKPQYNAAIYLEDANGGDTNVVLEHNWLLGYGFAVMVDATRTSLVGNRIGGDTHWGSCYLGSDTKAADITTRGNVDLSTGHTDPMCADVTPAPAG